MRLRAPVLRTLAPSRNLRVACAIALLVLWAGYCVHNLTTRVPYPTRDDQMDNLEQAERFTDHFVFYWRGPLYVAWLGGHLWLSGGDPRTAMYAEKITSMLLLGALMGWLGRRLWSWRAGLLMSAWILNCSFLVMGSTNNHALAASLFTLSLIFLASPPEMRRVPLALLALFLATQVRQEMWLVFGGAVLLLALWRVTPSLGGRGQAWTGATSTPRAWATAVLIGGIVFGVIVWRSGPPFAERANVAFGQTFAKNYVERHRLEAQYPDAWTSFQEILGERVPALTPFPRMSALSALTNYPGELRGHVLHNVRLAIPTAPAMILAVEHPLLMLVLGLALGLCLADRRERRLTLRYAVPAAAIVALLLAWSGVPLKAARHPVPMVVCVLVYAAYLGHAIVRDGPDRWRDLGRARRRLVLLWASLPLLILPLLLVFRMMPRYLTPLIPAGILWAAHLGQAAWLNAMALRRPHGRAPGG